MMAPAPDSPDRPHRATSSEPGSTRANPFDDADASSRKRRRTTASLSPVQSPSTLSITDAPVPDLSSPADVVAPAPRTPEHLMSSTDPSSEPPSSKVTINLRNTARNNNNTSSSSSTSPLSEVAQSIPEADEPQASVELVEGPESYESRLEACTPSSLDSATPPMELLAGPDEDNDMASDGMNGDGAVIELDEPWEDPIDHFPFAEPGDSILETVHSLTQYLSSTSSIEEAIADQLLQWLELHLRYAREVGRATAMETCRANRSFWLAFPDVLFAITNRRPTSHNLEALRPPFMQICSTFVELTAVFIAYDRITLGEYQTASGVSQQPPPCLFSPGYLQQIHSLLRRDMSESDRDRSLGPMAPLKPVDDASFFISKLLSAPTGNIRSLGNLVTGLVDIVPIHPKLSASLAPVCLVAADVLCESWRTLALGHPGVVQARENLELGHDIWGAISTSLALTIEKHVTSLNGDSTSCQIQALTDILKLCLHGDHALATTMLSNHRIRYPELSPDYNIDAIAWEWRFDVLDKLIRSSQMQLRVMAVTTMCNELVGVWKRHGETGDESGSSFLAHIGQYLIKNNLIEYILSPNCHPELVVESANIVGFLVVTKLYQPEHTDRLWQGMTSTQDPRVADALARMIGTITNLFDYATLLGICNKLQTLPIDGFNSSIRTLWDNVLRQMVAKCVAEHRTLTFHPYDLCLRLLRESSVCASGSQVAYPEIQHTVMLKFKELLGHGPDAEGRMMLYQSCIDDISATSPTSLGSLSCLSMAIRPGLVGELHLLTEKHGLARLIVEELEHAAKAGRAAGVFSVLSGPPNSPRRDFVTNMILLQPASLNNVLGERLWNILIGPQSPCQDDRNAGWQILIGILRQKPQENSFLRAALSQYLPALPSSCFCEGTHGFIREHVLSLVDNNPEFVFDDDTELAQSGIEQLWRIILEASDVTIVDLAIRTLAHDVYMESKSIRAYPFHRTRQVHLSLVNRCLTQLREAAQKIKAFRDGTTSVEDESMVVVASESQIQEQHRMFTRSLKLMRYFVEAHQSKPSFAAPDLRSLITQAPQEIEGALTQLKYQSFDGTQQTNVRPLSIGKLNTAASLLASLKRETGFGNYRVYYRGQLFHPSERDICKSLETLCIHEGLILVKRDDDGAKTTVRIKPGSSSLEIEILSHFEEMWEYLSMDEQLAREIYDFLVKLPADGHIVDLLENDTASHRDVFPPGQPFKSLYAIHALAEHVDTARPNALASSIATNPQEAHQAYGVVLRKLTSLIVQAISDEAVLAQSSKPLQMQLTSSLVQAFVQLLQQLHTSHVPFSWDMIGGLSASRLVAILSDAAISEDVCAYHLMFHTFMAICRLGLMDVKFWESITPDPTFVELIRGLALFDPRKPARASFLKIVEDTLQIEDRVASLGASDALDKAGDPARPLARFFWSVASDLIWKTVEIPGQSHEIFRLFPTLMVTMANKVPAAVDFQRLAGEASRRLLDHTSTERIGQTDADDPIASGFTFILHLCVQWDESLPTSGSLPEHCAERLFATHLFPMAAKSTESVQRVILNSDTRAKLCEIIFRLVKNKRQEFTKLLGGINSVVPYYEDEDDRPYLYDIPLQFDRSRFIRAPCGYVGLKNLSNTCYLNSLLTQLFMNTRFRSFILASKPPNPADQSLLFLTQKLFAFMQESYDRYMDPTDLVNSIKTYDDTPIDIHSQMDVDEFYSLLFDRWEGQLTTDIEKKRLRSFYGGQLVQQVKSKECEHISERLEPFSAIQCDIKGKSTLQDSLQAYVDGEIMEGENKYKCSTCDRHVDAVKRACLKDLPDSLIFHLKRFDFNLRTLQRSKINDYFAFPEKIDMHPYTIEHLSDTSNAGESDVFELVGVLVHSGTAESGHYYSYIKERPTSGGRNSWVEFNDDIVTPWDSALMESATFGGSDSRGSYDMNGFPMERTYSAYMLFYQRVSAVLVDQQAALEQQVSVPVRSTMDAVMGSQIIDENTLLLKRYCMFDPSHTVFVQHFFNQAKVLEESEENDFQRLQEANGSAGRVVTRHELKDLAMEVATNHLDQVVSRSKDPSQFLLFMPKIADAIETCSDCALAFFDYLPMRREAFRSMLQRNPEQTVRQLTGRALILALKKIATDLPHIYYPKNLADDNDNKAREVRRSLRHSNREISVIEGTVAAFNHLWRFFPGALRSWDELFGNIADFARLGSQEVAQLLSEDYLAKVLRIIVADQAIELPVNYNRMLNNVMRRINSRPPSYVEIIALIIYLLEQLEPVLGPECIVDASDERLDQLVPPFCWTSEEIQLTQFHPERLTVSFFAEKLIALDQAHGLTDQILARLVRTDPRMETRVCNAIRRNLQGSASTQAMDPFLRAAGILLECTQSERQVPLMIHHVVQQVRHLQHTEGLAFMQFYTLAVPLEPAGDGFRDLVRRTSLEQVPEWAPYLLVDSNTAIRREVTDFLATRIFRHIPSHAADDGAEEEERDELVLDVGRRLGFKCLGYLRDLHVKRRCAISREASDSILQVVDCCAPLFDTEAEEPTNDAIDFVALRSDVLISLRGLMVDELDDNGSEEWNGSDASSNQAHEIAELSMNAMSEIETDRV